LDPALNAGAVAALVSQKVAVGGGPAAYLNVSDANQAAEPCGVPGGPGVGFTDYANAADLVSPERLQRAIDRAA
jgi:hypothetical protein